jgi:hypothetical protein
MYCRDRPDSIRMLSGCRCDRWRCYFLREETSRGSNSFTTSVGLNRLKCLYYSYVIKCDFLFHNVCFSAVCLSWDTDSKKILKLYFLVLISPHQNMNLYHISIYLALYLCLLATSPVVNADLTCRSPFQMRNDSNIDQIAAKVWIDYYNNGSCYRSFVILKLNKYLFIKINLD